MKTKKIISVLTVLCLSFTFALGQSVLIDHFIGQYTAESLDVKLDIKQDSTYIMRINARGNNYDLLGRWSLISDDVLELTSSNYLCDIEHMNSPMQIVQKNDKSQDSIYFDFKLPSRFTKYPLYIDMEINETHFVRTTTKFSIPKTTLNESYPLDSTRIDVQIYNDLPYDFQLNYIYYPASKMPKIILNLDEFNDFEVQISQPKLLNYSMLNANKTIAFLDSMQSLNYYNYRFTKEIHQNELHQNEIQASRTQLSTRNLIGTYKNALDSNLFIELQEDKTYCLRQKDTIQYSERSRGDWSIVHSNCLHLHSCDFHTSSFEITGIAKGSPDSLYFYIRYSPEGCRAKKDWKYAVSIASNKMLYSEYMSDSLLVIPRAILHNYTVSELQFRFRPLSNIYRTNRRRFEILEYDLFMQSLSGSWSGAFCPHDENVNYFTLDLSQITDLWYDSVYLNDNVYILPNGNLIFQGSTWEKQ